MDLVKKLLASLFPSLCLVCRKTVQQHALNESIDICTSCYTCLPPNNPCCPGCALPLADDVDTGVLCGRCIQQAPVYDYAYSLFRYEDAVIKLVQQLKFGEKICIARSFAEMLQLKLADMDESPDCLLPVPLHKSRLRQRGFNQSIEISRVMVKKQSLAIEYDAVVRQHNTPAQSGLSAKQRQKNIKGAFKLKRALNYKHVLIIDDVMTTGATVNELARVLKKNNVARVGVLSIARAPVKN